MSSYSSSNTLKLLIVFLICGLLSTPLLGQSLFVEEAESTVIIQRDNLVRAKVEALKDAKAQVILQAVRRFLDFNSTVSLMPLLQQHFLEQPDFFIESIRVINEGNTSDLTEFTLKIETQIFRSRLLSAFRKLGLPTQEERISSRDVFLFYNADNALQQPKILDNFFAQLQTRLIPYRIRPKIIIIKNSKLALTGGLPARMELLANKTIKNSDRTAFALLELKLRLSPQPEQSQQGQLSAELIFWSQKADIPESSRSATRARAKLLYTSWQTEKIIPLILDKLLLEWTPVILKTLEVNQGLAELLKLKFKGIPGPIEEQLLIKTLFQNNPRWEKLNLTTISSKYLTYQALYLGKQGTILKEFRAPPEAPFRITSVYWENTFLVIKVKWKETPATLEPFMNTLLESGLDESDSTEEELPQPNLQVPLRTLKQTYSLPLKSSVYDQIRHRGDSTLFRIESPFN
ncbi:MAG: hypothetical protein VYC92_00925, partial [SAR324 cluster bacterium]|nr:hypothetical protein [SAR324 cluster bacterium]